MTREEAKDLLAMIEVKEPNELIVNSWWGSFVKDYKETLQIAIKALEQQPCEDCVSRQAVFDFIRSLPRWCVKSEDRKFNNVGLLYDDVMFGIDKLPSVTPKEKIGHWVNEKWYGTDLIGVTCSNCHVVESRFSAYCPNCGARMVSE